jgi:hypothetical protein
MDRLIPAQTEHETYPRNFLTLSRCSCSTFDHLELSFNHTAGDPNATGAINADDLDSGHPSPEHRHW